MFSMIFGSGASLGLASLILLVAVVVLLLVRVKSAAKTGHDTNVSDKSPKSPDVSTDALSTADDTVFDSVHKGKAHADGCKFDGDEVRRTQLQPHIAIDTSNLPAPDPRVQAVLADVQEARILDYLNKFTGEVPVTINGTTDQITSRSTFSAKLDLAFAYAESVYKALSISVGFHTYKVRGRTLRNVVAEIPGKTHPNKVLIIGCHIDSTAGRQMSAEPVAPGADDDGSGCVGMFEIARALKALSLEYTVRLVHFSGEEQGLWGSYAYSDVVAKEGKDIVGVLQIDMIGYSKSVNNRVDIHDGVDKNGSHALVVELFRQAKRYGLNVSPFDTHNHAVDDRSDHAGFLDHGYKAVLISAEFSDEAFNPNYHSTTDRVSTLNLPYMVEVVRMVIATSAELAKIQP